MSKPFRFGVVAIPQGDGAAWLATARRVAELGYSTLLMPDGVQLLSGFPALSAAATAVADLRVGSYVLAAPFRPPGLVAWEAHSMTVLTGGRFDLGIGAGRPAARAGAEQLGVPFGSAAERLQQVRQAVTALRALDGAQLHTPVLIAAGGPKARTLAAELADVVALAAGPLAGPSELAELADDVRARAGSRADELTLAMNVSVVGDVVPAWMQGFLGADAATLIAHDSVAMLRGSTSDLVEQLQRRRDRTGISYVSVSVAFAEQFAAVADLLSGR